MKRPSGKTESEAEETQEVPETPVKDHQSDVAKSPGVPKTKAKSKAKVVPKNKPKPHTKSKAKSKPMKAVAKSKLKKKEKEKQEKANMKKPACQKGGKTKASLRVLTQGWRSAAETTPQEEEMPEGEEEVKEEDPEVVPGTALVTLDYNKSRKWNKMMKSSAIPEELRQMFTTGMSKAENSRLFKAEFINKLFSKTKQGEYVLNPGNPTFASFKQSWDKKFSTEKAKGVPRSIMLYKNFGGNENGFNQALQDGDIFQKEDNLWYYRTSEVGRSKELADSMRLDGGSANVTADQYATFNSFMHGRPWAQFGEDSGSSSAMASVAAPAKALPALCDRPAEPKKVSFEVLQVSLEQAKSAQERLYKDAQKLVGKISNKADQALQNSLRAVMGILTENERKLQECLLWKSIIGTSMEKGEVDEFMKSAAGTTEKADEQLEQIKGVVKSRGW